MIGGLPGLFFFLFLLVLVFLMEEYGDIILQVICLIFFGGILLALLAIGV